MKKFFAFLLAGLLIFSPVTFADFQVQETTIPLTTFNAVTTTTTGDVYTGESKRVAFFVTYDETQVGAAISGVVTIQISFDKSTWLSAKFYDYSGGTTLQTTETITADGSYYFWMDPNMIAPFIRVTFTAINTDADDLLVMSCLMTQQK